MEPGRAAELDRRFAAAFEQLRLERPEVFAGTDLDPEANRQRMEVIVVRVEKLAASLRGSASGDDAVLSPTTRLAAMLKEALASNTIGGKVDEGSRVRAAQEDVRQAQANWSRIGLVPEAARRALADRFQRACRLIAEAGQAVGAGAPGPGGMTGAGRTGAASRLGGSAKPGRADGSVGAARLVDLDQLDVEHQQPYGGLWPCKPAAEGSRTSLSPSTINRSPPAHPAMTPSSGNGRLPLTTELSPLPSVVQPSSTVTDELTAPRRRLAQYLVASLLAAFRAEGAAFIGWRCVGDSRTRSFRRRIRHALRTRFLIRERFGDPSAAALNHQLNAHPSCNHAVERERRGLAFEY